MQDSISYVVTVYNKAPCLEEMIKSLLAQEGDFEREFVFVNDGSTDDSLEALTNLTKDMKNVKIITQKNQGPSVAQNTGLKNASNKWCYLVDGDDYLYPDATITLLFLSRIYNDSKVIVGRREEPPKYKSLFDHQILYFKDSLLITVRDFALGASTAIVDRELALSVGGSDERAFIQDYSISLRLSMQTPFVIINKAISVNIEKNQARLSSNSLDENCDTSLARFLFMKDNIDHIGDKYKYIGLWWHMKVAIAWERRYTKWTKNFIRYIIAIAKLPNDYNDLIPVIGFKRKHISKLYRLPAKILAFLICPFPLKDKTLLLWMEEVLGVYKMVKENESKNKNI